MTTPLVQQVACVETIDPDLLDRVRHETLTIPDGWVTEYGEYQSGGWGTLSLLNQTGTATDVTITDCEPVATDLLAAMPTTRQLLSDLGLRYMWARIARLEPGSFLWEHRDYGELKSVERHRLHIPLVTSSAAYLVVGGSAVHLSTGRLWRLTPTHAHGACNRYGPPRLHLILDCYSSQELAELTNTRHLPDDAVRPLPPLTDALAHQQVTQALTLARLGYHDAAEQYLLQLYFTHESSEGQVYDLLHDLHATLGDTATAQQWRHRKSILLGTAS
ncbi:aspartyl/asparaginyl beta-hydroxylase domain-containing protein [Sphaerisporangium sp. NPDC049002]|uniref:aspartyl/asparaginyl beta-hydroxylase domain-containing protein n=1 Tax=Sphaerisporangium sp. NPDC049002 TaxID=3155392 RepID=UPI0033C7BF24